MDRAQATLVARVHGLQHVQRLPCTHLAHDDPRGPHPEAVDHQVASGDVPLPLGVRRPRLETNDVLLVEDELRRVLDGDDALVLRDRLREDPQERRLARARAS